MNNHNNSDRGRLTGVIRQTEVLILCFVPLQQISPVIQAGKFPLRQEKNEQDRFHRVTKGNQLLRNLGTSRPAPAMGYGF